MCGILAIVDFSLSRPVKAFTLRQMRDTMAHRGPDEAGEYFSDYVALGHRRLSIIDLAASKQPLGNEDNTIVIVFNGEIYNFQSLRRELLGKGHRFRTDGDTEVLIHAYEEWGMECLQRLNGMFAFAIWDSRNQRLFAARDRLGQKPLNYSHQRDRLVVASEIKAILELPSIERRVDLCALDQFLTFGFIPSPLTIFRDIRKLPPGHFLLFDRTGLKVERYWSPPYSEDPGLRNPRQIADCLRELLQDAVRIRLVSDVPLGALLSGGLDSTSIVSLMAQVSADPVQTFSIGFDEPAFGELAYARLAAQRFGTDHHEFVVRPQTFDVMRTLAWQFDEPFADLSAVPTYYVSKLARKHVTVCLSGDGGDELLGGYGRYAEAETLERQAQWTRPLAPLLSRLVRLMRYEQRGRGRLRAWTLDSQERYVYQVSLFDSELRNRLYSSHVASALNGYDATEPLRKLLELATHHFEGVSAAMWADLNFYLPEDILVKVDRASMLNSLEIRCPLLDHRVVEFIVRLPLHFKRLNGTSKVVLRQALADLLPVEIQRRSKRGFSAPLGKWFREQLCESVEAVLFSSSFEERGWFQPRTVQALVERHQTGRIDYSRRLGALLWLELWARVYLDGQSL